MTSILFTTVLGKELNAWYRQEELPEDADGDIAYFEASERASAEQGIADGETSRSYQRNRLWNWKKDLANPSGILRICF